MKLDSSRDVLRCFDQFMSGRILKVLVQMEKKFGTGGEKVKRFTGKMAV